MKARVDIYQSKKPGIISQEIFRRTDQNNFKCNLVQCQVFFPETNFSADLLPRRFLESRSFCVVKHYQSSAADELSEPA